MGKRRSGVIRTSGALLWIWDIIAETVLSIALAGFNRVYWIWLCGFENNCTLVDRLDRPNGTHNRPGMWTLNKKARAICCALHRLALGLRSATVLF